MFVDPELVPRGRWAEAEQRRDNPFLRLAEQRLAKARVGELEATLFRARDRLRLIGPARRFVLVDTATHRLWMVEDGRIVGTMKVVTGNASMPTPEMAALIRYAVLDPYWNLPPDLVRDRVINHVLADGRQWLDHAGLRPVSHYGDGGRRLDPDTVDWFAIAMGHGEVGLRQDPGPRNTMGAVKFMFPNDLGIYLHDTPERRLFRAANRRFSSGCVRLEHAGRLYEWLFGAALPTSDLARPERRVGLPAPVPVYIFDLGPLMRDSPGPEAGRSVADSGPARTPRRGKPLVNREFSLA